MWCIHLICIFVTLWNCQENWLVSFWSCVSQWSQSACSPSSVLSCLSIIVNTQTEAVCMALLLAVGSAASIDKTEGSIAEKHQCTFNWGQLSILSWNDTHSNSSEEIDAQWQSAPGWNNNLPSSNHSTVSIKASDRLECSFSARNVTLVSL